MDVSIDLNSKKSENKKVKVKTKSKMDPKLKEKLITYSIYAVFIIGIIIFMVISLKNDNTNTNNTISDVEQTITSEETPDTEHHDPTDTPVTEQPSTQTDTNTSENEQPGSHIDYYYPDDECAYLDDYDGTARCRVYMPANYTYVKMPLDCSLWLKPANLDTTVDGNDPLIVCWQSVMFMNQLKNNTTEFKYGQYTYRLLETYEYAYDTSNKTNVYVLEFSWDEITLDENNTTTDTTNEPNVITVTHTAYQVIVDYNLEGVVYPNIYLYEDQITQYIGNRYTDIQSLAKTIFKPL